MPHVHPAFQIDVTPGPDACLIRLRGELDLAGTPALERALTDAEESGKGRILLDLEALTFADSSALNVLSRAGRRSAANGDRLLITRGRGQVARMFRLTALYSSLPFARGPRAPKLRQAG